MSITKKTQEEIRLGGLGHFRGQPNFADKDLSDLSFLGLTADAVSQGVVVLQDEIEQADNDGVPGYQQDVDGELRSRTSPAALDNWAFVVGTPTETEGRYGRRGPTPSSGGRATPEAAIPTFIPSGTQLTDGQVVVQTTGAITTDGPPNTVSFGLVSVTKGAQANLSIGTVLTFISPIPAVSPEVTLTSALTGGKDREAEVELLGRVIERTQRVRKGGTVGDNRGWAEEAVDANGVSTGCVRAYVFPHRGGLGTVHTLLTSAGSGLARASAGVADTQAYVDKKRPVCQPVTCASPPMFSDQALKIRAFVDPALPKYGYDWDDLGDTRGIFSGSTTTLVISMLLWNATPTLAAAIDTGRKPRIQVGLTTAPAASTPYVRRVLSYQLNVPGAGFVTLNLESALPVAPAFNDPYCAGSPLVEPAAQKILDYVDSLGPSRQSGYADPTDPWEDKVAIARIAQSILNTKDTDGTRFVRNTPNLPIDGIEIAVGAGAFSTNDYQTRDIFTWPELAFVARGGILLLRAQ